LSNASPFQTRANSGQPTLLFNNISKRHSGAHVEQSLSSTSSDTGVQSQAADVQA
jgi:hypothetical protein